MRFSKILALGFLAASAGFSSCEGKRGAVETVGAPTAATPAKRTNLTILLDLSNRINARFGQDTQQNRDVAIVKAASTWFKSHMEKQGALKAKDRFAIYFEPQPQMDANLDQVARSLQVDLGKPEMDPKAKKEVYNKLVAQTTAGVERLYEFVKQQPQDGADLWGFAKEKMAARCIMDTSMYRNVLIVVTDGYLDHVRNRSMRDGNKAAFFNDTYIQNELVKKGQFTAANWAAKYEAGKYGLLVPPGTNLKGLDVLVLEINTYSRPPFYADIVNRYVTDWFKAMGANRVEVRATDVPTYTEENVKAFLK
ncbi:hypothetical protein LRS06_02580 [Hymenobacter sp. J193]|uniref:hypothetical protein n=1 Tax=Hymenobacter sp. J193 TaxID=2898429 RepID=UPI0021519696|nr:hypothetical protein [Hymenobacter sp. J193]MCR5886677.1 hypothetical protein [Hymenobacter sp. J193]